MDIEVDIQLLTTEFWDNTVRPQCVSSCVCSNVISRINCNYSSPSEIIECPSLLFIIYIFRILSPPPPPPPPIQIRVIVCRPN